MRNSRSVADSDAFELLRVKPRRLSPNALFAVLVALVVAIWFAIGSWTGLQDAREAQAHRVALAAARIDQKNRSSSELSAGLVRNASARRALRDSTVRWLTEVERCHPNGARVRALRLDAIENRASMDVTLPAATSDLEPWLSCLNEEIVFPAWRLIRVTDMDGGGHVRHVYWERRQE